MNDWIIYAGLPDVILLLLGVIVVAGLIGWGVGRRKAKELARQQADLLEALPHGAVIVRSDGRVILANAEAQQLWGAGTFPARLEGDWLALCGQGQPAGIYRTQNLDAPSGLKLGVRVAPLSSDSAMLVLQDLAAQQQLVSLRSSTVPGWAASIYQGCRAIVRGWAHDLARTCRADSPMGLGHREQRRLYYHGSVLAGRCVDAKADLY
jgi:hypothetical protein